MRFAPVALAAFALLSGCLESDPPAAEATVDDGRMGRDLAMDEPQSQSSEIHWDASLGPMGLADLQFGANNGASLDVDDGRETLLANVTWSCGTPMCDLHVYLCDPDEAETVGAGAPDCAEHALGASPVSFEVADPMEGHWLVTVMGDSPSIDLVGTIEFYVE